MPKDVLSATNMFIDSFIGYLKSERGYSPHTLTAYKNDLQSFDAYLRGVDVALSLSMVDSDVVRGWAASLMDKGESTTSVNRRLSSLHTFFTFMRSEGYVSVNPVDGINRPKCRKVLPSFLKETEIDAVVDGLESSVGFEMLRNKTVLLCFYSTGIRLAELVGLDMSSVDMAGCTLKVKGKRNRERVIPFAQELHSLFEEYIEERAKVALPDESAFFVSSRGTRISRSTVYRMVNSALRRESSLNKCSPHVLRHTFATAMLNNNAELGAVKELLGHRRLATTEVYTHLTFEELIHFYKKAHPRAGN